MTDKKILALYLRLSSEDASEADESNSITNQRFLAYSFIRQFNLDEYEVVEYADDGFTGKNLERPNMQRLLQDIRERKVGMIVVKDFSRLARDHIIMGDFIDKIFPFMQIRFISINDHYDSDNYVDRTPDLDVPFLNLIYDYYSEECSVKIKNGIHTVQEKGGYYTFIAPFGYGKSKTKKNQLVIDDKTSAIVKRTFYLRGVLRYSKIEIARLYNKEKVMKPTEYMNIRAGKKLRDNQVQKQIWTTDIIEHILNNPVYLGITISGKTETIGPGIKKIKRIPKEKCRMIKDTHPALVTQELFDIVQSMEAETVVLGETTINSENAQQMMGDKTKRRKRVLSGKYKMPEDIRVTAISGMVQCGICGHKMQRRYSVAKKTHYFCYYANMSDKSECMHGGFPELELIELVLLSVNQQMEVVAKLQEIQDAHNKQIKKKRKEAEKKRKQLQSKKEALKLEYMEIYQNYQEGILSKEHFLAFKKEMNKKENFMDTELAEIDTVLKQAISENNPFLKMFEGKTKLEKLTRDVSEQLIDEIKVYSKQRVEVIFKYQDDFEKAMMLRDSIESKI